MRVWKMQINIPVGQGGLSAVDVTRLRVLIDDLLTQLADRVEEGTGFQCDPAILSALAEGLRGESARRAS